jgi:predicted DNA-binding transcriptional regulator YafY
VISLKLIPNPELMQLLLSYGAGVKVLEPQPLREKIKESHREAVERIIN